MQRSSSASYARTLMAAVGLAVAIWVLYSFVLLLYEIRRMSGGHATGLGLVWGGALEGVITATLLGFIGGSIWYVVKRRK